MKIFVTGATGYVGNALALKLANDGHNVNILVRDSSSKNIPVHQGIHVFEGDITNRGTLVRAMQQCQQVYHTAALVKLWAKDKNQFYRVNVEGTENVLAVALQTGVKKLVFTSTCGVLGASLKEPLTEDDPRIKAFDNEYEFTKSIAESLVRKYAQNGLSTVIVSLSKVFGPGIETHPISVNQLTKKFIEGKLTFIPKPGSLISNFCFIDDIVRGHLLAMDKGMDGEKYILGGANISYTDFFETIRKITFSTARLVEAPKWCAKVFAAMYWLKQRLTGNDLFFTVRGVNHVYCDKAFRSGKAVDHLGYQPTAIKDALEQTINFLKTASHEQ